MRRSGSPVATPLDTRLAVRVHLRIATCRNLLMRESRRSVEPWGLTLPQFDVLAELGRSKRAGFTFGELSRLLLVTSGNLTGIVDRLESEGLARRLSDRRDKRVVRIVLTRKGRDLVERILPLHARDIRNSLEFMAAGDLNALSELLGTVRDCLRDRPSVTTEQVSAEKAGSARQTRRVAPGTATKRRAATPARHHPRPDVRMPAWRDDHERMDETLFRPRRRVLKPRG